MADRRGRYQRRQQAGERRRQESRRVQRRNLVRGLLIIGGGVSVIALAAPGRLETFDNFDEQGIRQFILKNLDR